MKDYKESRKRYLKEKVALIKVYVPIEEKEKIQTYAKTKARSTNAYIVDLIRKDMENNDIQERKMYNE